MKSSPPSKSWINDDRWNYEEIPWGKNSGAKMLQELQPIFHRFGFHGRIVGSVATGEASYGSDLDIKLDVTPEAEAADNFDIEGLVAALVEQKGLKQAEAGHNYGFVGFQLPDGRVLDFYLTDEMAPENLDYDPNE